MSSVPRAALCEGSSRASASKSNRGADGSGACAGCGASMSGYVDA